MIPTEIGKLAELIASWIRAGLDGDEILARLNNPSDVGRRMLERAIERQRLGEQYLGRKPEGG